MLKVVYLSYLMAFSVISTGTIYLQFKSSIGNHLFYSKITIFHILSNADEYFVSIKSQSAFLRTLRAYKQGKKVR